MSTLVNNRTPKSSNSGGRSLFYQDLASPISARSKEKFSTPGQSAAISALWRENFGSSDLPPPPMYTLEDRSDFSPESGIPDYPLSPEFKSDLRSGLQFSGSSGREFRTPVTKSKLDRSGGAGAGSSPSGSGSTPFVLMNGSQSQQQSGSSNLNWWGPAKGSSSEQEDKGKSGSPVEGVVQPGALITLPPPREVARPEMMQWNSLPAGNLNEEEWVTVYGFSFGDMNEVLREFEKCGVILKHVPGPRGANWMHILYQSHADAQKALSKNGILINGVLMVGVKLVDPMQRQALNERLNNQKFMTLPPAPSSKTSEFKPSGASSRPYYLQNGSNSARQSGGAIASPAKSVVSKIFDVMFGI